ncbi:MAG: universal stress protein [Rhodobacteraceae bacterium]|nr:universal stress protein [Paracoccaceae bacterium]MBR9821780.1 universal stress protein [Paracoccaceae bacterium]
MPDNILVATDLSIRSERALRRAAKLAEQHDARLTVLCIVDEDLPQRVATRMRDAMIEDLALHCEGLDHGHAVQRVEIADPVQGILGAIEESGADLLVLGVHRHRPIWDLVYGTTMERVLRVSSVPVLLVKSVPHAPYARVLAGLDMSEACATAIRMAHELAPEASLSAFHAVHVPYRGLVAPRGSAEALSPFLEEAERRMRTWWQGADLPETLAMPRAEAAGRTELLMRRLSEIGPDLLAIGAHSRSSFTPTILGSFTEQILRDPPCDVLVLRR